MARHYAQALFELDGSDARSVAQRARDILARRGHLKLAPRVISEYENVALAHERRAARQTPSREAERTRVLLQLYRKLVASG